MDKNKLKHELSSTAKAVNRVLDELLLETNGYENRVVQAMRYACLGDGKRVRPFLVCASAALFGVESKYAFRTAAAVEMVHCYSLVHDDLPAMDNDVLRRGKPTCHIEFDEATAILAGDALLTKAFQVLADKDTHADHAVRISLISALATAAGAEGMVGGQMIDLFAEEQNLDLIEIKKLQRMKTGALIMVSCEMGAILGKATKEERDLLRKYSYDIGLAFQIADDLLDATGNESEVGKKIQKDANAGKATFVSLLGIDEARRQMKVMSQKAQEHLNLFGKRAHSLKNLANFIVNRRS